MIGAPNAHFNEDRPGSIFVFDYDIPVLDISIDPEQEFYQIDEQVIAEICITHNLDSTASYRLLERADQIDSGFYLEELDGKNLIEENFTEQTDFTLSAVNKIQNILIPFTPIGPGITTLRVTLERTNEDQSVEIFTAEVDVVMDPLTVELVITPETLRFNETPEEQLGEHSRQLNDDRRNEGLQPRTPYTTKFEVEMAV